MNLALFLFALAAFGQAPQPTERVLQFKHTTGEQNYSEIATAIRAITDVPQLWADAKARTLSIRGSREQMTAAEWIFQELDKPATQEPPKTAPETRVPDSGGDTVIRVFHTANAPATQNLQELATCARALIEVRRLFTYSALRAIIVRGSPEQIEAIDWILRHLDRPASPANTASAEYQLPDPRGEGVIRIFHTANTSTVRELQEVATCVRATSDIRRLFTYNLNNAIAVRGTPEQIQLAEWLIREIDKPAVTPGNKPTSSADYIMNDKRGEGAVRVFFLNHAATVQRLQEIATHVRTTTGIRRVFTYNQPRALTLRGTTAQIVRAQGLIEDSAK